MAKLVNVLSIFTIISLSLLLTGCPLPVSSSRSSENVAQLTNRFNQDYPAINGYKILLFVPSYSYIDIYMVAGSLQDGSSPLIKLSMWDNQFHQVQHKRITDYAVECFYVKSGSYHLLFDNKYISPKTIEKDTYVNQPVNIINFAAHGLFGSATLSVKQLGLIEALPFIYGRFVERNKCSIL